MGFLIIMLFAFTAGVSTLVAVVVVVVAVVVVVVKQKTAKMFVFNIFLGSKNGQ